jgi:hypothetical protein
MIPLRTFLRGPARAGVTLCALLSVLQGAPALADGQADLREALARLDGRAAIHAELAVETYERYGVGRAAVEKSGQVTLRVEEGETGLQMVYGAETLARMEAEAQARSRDPMARTPTRQAVTHLEAPGVQRMLAAASGLAHQLEEARFTGERADSWHGRPARLLSFTLPVTSLDEEQRKYVRSFDGTLQVWIAPDGTPLASASRVRLQGRAFIIVGFQREDDEDSTYAVSGDRLVATGSDMRSVGSGAGERAELRVVKTLTPQ